MIVNWVPSGSGVPTASTKVPFSGVLAWLSNRRITWLGKDVMVPERTSLAPSSDTGPLVATNRSRPELFTSARKVEPELSVNPAVTLTWPVAPKSKGLTVLPFLATKAPTMEPLPPKVAPFSR